MKCLLTFFDVLFWPVIHAPFPLHKKQFKVMNEEKVLNEKTFFMYFSLFVQLSTRHIFYPGTFIGCSFAPSGDYPQQWSHTERERKRGRRIEDTSCTANNGLKRIPEYTWCEKMDLALRSAGLGAEILEYFSTCTRFWVSPTIVPCSSRIFKFLSLCTRVQASFLTNW